MKIEIPFNIKEKVWYIDPRTFKAKEANIKGIKATVDADGQKVKYNLDIASPNDEFYVWNVFKTKQELLNSI